MIYSIKNGILSADSGEWPARLAETQYVWIAGAKEMDAVGGELHLSSALKKEIQTAGDVSKHESHEGLDFIMLSIIPRTLTTLFVMSVIMTF